MSIWPLLLLSVATAGAPSGAKRARRPAPPPPPAPVVVAPEPTPPPAPPPLPTAAPPPVAAPGAKLLRVAVTDFEVIDDAVETRVARIVADDLVAELRKLQGVSVISMDEVRTMLAVEATREVLSCSDDRSCLSELTEALGAEVVVSGTISRLNNERVLTIRRIVQGEARVAATFDERLVPAGGEELLAALGPAVTTLFPERALLPGQVRGVSAAQARLLNPPPLPVWSTSTVAGVAALSLAVGGTLGVLAGNEATALQKVVDDSAQAPVSGASVVVQEQRVQGYAIAANVGLGLGAALGATSVVMALFTDWRGAGTTSSE